VAPRSWKGFLLFYLFSLNLAEISFILFWRNSSCESGVIFVWTSRGSILFTVNRQKVHESFFFVISKNIDAVRLQTPLKCENCRNLNVSKLIHIAKISVCLLFSIIPTYFLFIYTKHQSQQGKLKWLYGRTWE
jgi:hypothetical protein